MTDQQVTPRPPDSYPKPSGMTKWRGGIVMAAILTSFGGMAPVSGGQPGGSPATLSSGSIASPEGTDNSKAKAVEALDAGQKALEQGNVGQAIAHFEEAVRIDPLNTAARNHLASALQIKRDLDGAIKPKEKQTPEIDWRSTGIVAAIIGAFATILAAVVALIVVKLKGAADSPASNQTVSPEIRGDSKVDIDNNPSNVNININKQGLDEEGVGKAVAKGNEPLAQDLSAVREEVQAIRSQLAQAQLAPKQPVPDSEDPLEAFAVEFFNAGVDAYVSGEFGQAIGHYLDALELATDHVDAHINLGSALAAKGDHDGAIGHYKEARRIDPDEAVVHYNLGTMQAGKGDFDGAIGHLEQAIRIDPDYASAYYNLGCSLADKGDIDGAIEQYNIALRVDPDDVKTEFNLGVVLSEKGDHDGAMGHYEKALRIDPDYPKAHSNLGAVLADKGDHDGAIGHYKEALRIDPKCANAYFNLGCAFAQKGDFAAAVAALAKAIELDSKNRDEAKSDKDFDPIRDDPGFRKLVYGE